MPSAVGGFFSGLRQGIETGQQVRRNRQIEQLVDRELDKYDLSRSGQLDQFINEGGDPSDFPEFDGSSDPFLIRGFKWLRGRLSGQKGGGSPEGAFVSSSTTGALPSPGVMMSADGGMVRKAIPYADGGEVIDEDTFLDDLGRNAAALPGRMFPSTAATGKSVGSDLAMRGRKIAGAEDEFEVGRRTRQLVGEGVIGTGRMVSALTDDALGPLDDSLVGAGKAALGFLGFGGRHKPAPATTPTAAAQPPSALPTDKEAAASTAAGGGKEQPSDVMAAQAVQTAVGNTPGHPDNPDQDFNWAEVADAGATPDEIPHVGVKDWVDYRKNYVLAAIKQGKSPADAHQEVDQIQMRGAMSNLNQASYLLRAGQPRAAALAARAAFQYFPNGSDVRFGIHQTDSGPVLVGMGIDEETGEPIREGKPMMLTAETMSVMAENFSNPAAFRTWTKDWRDEEFKRREYNEVTKPVAESDAVYKDRAGRAALMRGQADLNRSTASLFSAAGGTDMDESDFRASFDRIAEDLSLNPEIEPEDVLRIRDMGTRLRQLHPSQGELSDERIVTLLLNAYTSGDFSEIEPLLEQ